MSKKPKNGRQLDHEFVGDDKRGAACRHRAPYGWIANIACGWPRSAHRKRKAVRK